MRLKGLFVLGEKHYDVIYGPESGAEIGRLIDVVAPPQSSRLIKDNSALLRDVDVILSGWGGPVLDQAFLAAAPRLKAFLYGAGSVRGLITDAAWDRDIVVASAYGANAVPVSEYTLAAILFALKRVWFYARTAAVEGRFAPGPTPPGAYGSTVGLVSLGMIGRRVAGLLKSFDVRVLAYDPFAGAQDAQALNLRLVALDELFRQADVVSLHTPNLPETKGLITGRNFASMKAGATFINTARGAVVCEEEMIQALRARPDITAVLDVTHPEPPAAGSPLYSLPNVMLTPHIAGSMGAECRRMGRYMVEELRRFIAGEPLRWRITREMAARLA